jgi:hypothetical protein
MKAKSAYLFLCLAGTILPYWQFMPWLLEHGLDLPRLFADLFANRVSAFFGLDVVVSAVVVIAFALFERARLGAAWWLPILGTMTVGVSLGLPLALYLCEVRQGAGRSG